MKCFESHLILLYHDTDLVISVMSRPRVDQLIFGGAPIGCLYKPVSEADACATVKRALDAGISYFDTAPLYGAGLSESRLGAVLASRMADGIRIATKVGRVILDSQLPVSSSSVSCQENLKFLPLDSEARSLFFVDDFLPRTSQAFLGYSADACRESVLQSLRRLQVTSLHVVRLHDPDDDVRLEEATSSTGALEALFQLKNEKTIERVSVGTADVRRLQKLVEKYENQLDNVMLASKWNLLDQEGLELLQACAKRHITVHIAGAFAGGALWGGENCNYEKIRAETQEKIVKWKKVCSLFGLKVEEAALQWALLPGIVSHVAIGMASVEEVEANVGLCGDAVKVAPAELWQEAKKQGLLRADIDLSELERMA